METQRLYFIGNIKNTQTRIHIILTALLNKSYFTSAALVNLSIWLYREIQDYVHCVALRATTERAQGN